jgi:hypothetical protein
MNNTNANLNDYLTPAEKTANESWRETPLL